MKQNEIIKNLNNHLSSKGKIDLIVFTGDLVNTGEHYEDFNDVNELFIKKIVKDAGIPDGNFIFCAGNHDVFRNQEMEAIKTHISKEINTMNF